MAHKDSKCPKCKGPLTIYKVKGDDIHCACKTCDKKYVRSFRAIAGGKGAVWGGNLIQVGFLMEGK